MLWGYIAIISYLLTTAWLGMTIARTDGGHKLSWNTGIPALLTAALVFHGFALYQLAMTSEGISLGFYSALSLISWIVVLLVFVVSILKPADNLALVFLPAAAIALLLQLLMPHTYILPDDLGLGLRMHILLSVTAYSMLTIAAVQALLLAFQERQLRNKHPARSIRLLPPMQSMENLLVQLLAIGFFLLSLSLSTGLVFVNDIFAQHLSHKVVFSILAWLIFALVLWGRWIWGWRGRKLIRWTLGGFGLLLLAYFGSKFVLELVLQKV